METENTDEYAYEIGKTYYNKAGAPLFKILNRFKSFGYGRTYNGYRVYWYAVKKTRTTSERKLKELLL